MPNDGCRRPNAERQSKKARKTPRPDVNDLFQLFNCSVWPSEKVRDVVLDLVLLRNLLVHNSGQDWSHGGHVAPAYAGSFGALMFLTFEGTVSSLYSVDHHRALLFVREATLAVVEQLKYLEQHLVRDISWAESE